MREPPVGQSPESAAALPGEPGQAPVLEVAPSAPEVGPVVAPVAPIDAVEPYRRWATALFTILAVVGIVSTVVVLGAIPGVATLWVLIGSVVLLIATLLIVILALRRREPWAVHAIAPICYVIIAAAMLRVVVAANQGNVTIPLEGIGALMVLTRNHRSDLLPAIDEGARRQVWLAVAAIVVAQILPYVLGPR